MSSPAGDNFKGVHYETVEEEEAGAAVCVMDVSKIHTYPPLC